MIELRHLLCLVTIGLIRYVLPARHPAAPIWVRHIIPMLEEIKAWQEERARRVERGE